MTYTKITSADNQPGIYNVTGGSADYVLPMPTKFTLFIRCKPDFAYNVATDQPLAGWYVDADNHFLIYYEASDDTIKVIWKDGGTVRELTTAAYVSNLLLQVWHNIAVAFDSTTGTTAGSALYINQASADAVWSGNIDAKGMEYPLFSIRHEAGVIGDWTINQVRYFSGKVASAADVANLFADLEEEEVVWNFNGEACGRTRCNVTRHVLSMGLERKVEEPSTGSQGANRLTASLYSHGGEYADDQYAAFSPTAEQFNGTSSQKYLQKQSRLEAESWYGTSWEPLFIGRLDSSMYSRTSSAGGLTTVDIVAEDGVSDIARELKRKAYSFEAKQLSDITEANSLIHLIARLATRKDIYNYLANSSFENATIANSWSVAGSGATFVRAAGGLFGSYQGDLDYAATTCTVTQTVTFTGTKKLNKDEVYTFAVWARCASAVSNAASLIKLSEENSTGSNADTSTLIVLAGGEGWKRFEVTHTITDATSDRLKAIISLGEAVVLSVDGAMLVQAERMPAFWVYNDNDGTGGVESADDADYASYDTVGFDCDAVAVTHPWVFIPAVTSIWEHLKELSDACGCMYLGMDACGVLKFRAKLKIGYTDPSPIETIGDDIISSVTSIIELMKANKIIGHGVKVTVSTVLQNMWMLEAVASFIEEDNSKPYVSVSNGSYFPDPTDYGDFWAKYGNVTEKKAGLLSL